MLKKLVVENYQSHEHSELEFHPGVNVIVGESTSGKTALFRAINWVVNNRPLGGRIKSNFAEKNAATSVQLMVGDSTVILEKKKLEAFYTLSTPEGSDKFKGFGADVPDVVRKAINLGGVNVQEQLDQHFLICASPGEVARVVNQVTKVEQVDQWVSKLTTKINTINSGISFLESDIKTITDRMVKFAVIPDLEKHVSELEQLDEKVVRRLQEYEGLLRLFEELKVVQNDLEDLTKRLVGLDEHVQDLDSFLQGRIYFYKLKDLLKEYVFCMVTVNENLELVKEIEPELSGLQELVDCRGEKSKLLVALVDLANELHSVDSEVGIREVDMEAYIGSLRGLLKTLKKCPTCSSPLDEKDLDRVLEEVV